MGRERAREEEFDQKYERERQEGDGARAVERRGGGRESNTRREREGRDAEVPDGGVSMDDETRLVRRKKKKKKKRRRRRRKATKATRKAIRAKRRREKD